MSNLQATWQCPECSLSLAGPYPAVNNARTEHAQAHVFETKKAREEHLRFTGPEGAEKLRRPVTELGLSGTVERRLRWHGITLVADLVQRTQHDLYEMKNVGKTTIREIKRRLEEVGLALKP